MQKSQNAVADFMRLYGQALPSLPTIPDEKTREMRINSLAEEVGELAMASGITLSLTAHPDWTKPQIDVQVVPQAVPNLEQIADALVDCQYFVDGTANAYGLDLMPFFEEVHRANMTKLWAAKDLVSIEPGWTATAVTVTYQDGGFVLPPEKQDGRAPVPVLTMFIVKRPDGKVMKPPGFKPADLRNIMELQKCRHDDFDPDKVNPKWA